jgi:hypothetical protein
MLTKTHCSVSLFCIMCVFFVIFLTNRENEFSGFANQKDSRDQEQPGEWKFEGYFMTPRLVFKVLIILTT